MWENARLFGLLNMALADGYIGTFETKYQLQLLATGHRDPDWPPPTATRTPTPTRPGPRW